MANPPLITNPFASNGDKSALPATDPNGFVNFASGYTPDYEVNLTSGDPQAKAVERGVQNYLFNILTNGMQQWQYQNRPAWYGSIPGGYSQWAEVMYPTDGSATPKPYRSLVSANVAAPTDATKWEYIQGSGEMIKNVPMPSGGTSGPGSMLISVATDFNTLIAPGTYQYQSDAVVSGSAHAPANGSNVGAAGMLEVMSWQNGPTQYVTQFFRDRNGLGFMRGSAGGTWTIWKIWANSFQYVVGEVRMWSGVATDAAVQAAYGPGWHLCNGANGTPNLTNQFIIGAGGSYAVGASGGSTSVTLSVANMPSHNHVINIGDPGHAHGVYDPGHNHGVNDPGHAHGVYDPGHAHGIPTAQGDGVNGNININGGTSSSRNTNGSGTGIGIYGNGTGISIAGSGSNIGIYTSGTGISASSNTTGNGSAFTVIPPYYALCYVMYTGA